MSEKSGYPSPDPALATFKAEHAEDIEINLPSLPEKPPPGPPSWEEAIKKRHAAQFWRTVRKNGHATSERVLFELNAPRDQISADSPGLGFFFRFDAILARLLIVWSLVCLIPLALNIYQANSTDGIFDNVPNPIKTYQLVNSTLYHTSEDVPSAFGMFSRKRNVEEWAKTFNAATFYDIYRKTNTTVDALLTKNGYPPNKPLPSSWATVNAFGWAGSTDGNVDCPKAADVESAILTTTIGSFCTRDTKGYGCSNACFVQPWCAIRGNGSCSDFTTCNRRGVNSERTSNAEIAFNFFADFNRTGVATPDQWNSFFTDTCSCCDLDFVDPRALEVQDAGEEVEQYEGEPVPLPHLITWLFLFCFYLAWVAFAQRVENKSATRIGNANITAADYSVWVTGLARTDFENTKLIEFARHYGEVVAAFHVPLLGRPLQGCAKVHSAHAMLQELRAIQAKRPSLCSLSSRGCLGLIDRITAWGIQMFHCRLRSPEKACKAQETYIKKLKAQLLQDQQGPLPRTGNALIIFNYERHAKQFLADMRTKQGIIVDSGKLEIRASAIDKDPVPFRGVSRAPEPRDVNWEVGTCTGNRVLLLRAASWTVFLAALVISGVIQNAILDKSQEELANRLSEENKNAMQSYTEKIWHAAISYSTLQSLAVVTINYLGYLMCIAITNWETYIVGSRHNTSLTFKLSIFYIVNTILLLFTPPVRGNRALWYDSGGLMQTLITTQLIDALTPFIYLFDPINYLNYFILARHARTQEYLNQCLQPLPFDLPLRYAQNIKTAAMALCYTPVVPVAPLIALVALFISHCVDRYMALRVDAKPKDLDRHVLLAFNLILLFLAPLQILLLWVYFDNTMSNPNNTKNGDGYFYAFVVFPLVLWLVVLLIPLIWGFKQRWKPKVDTRDTGRTASFWDTVGDASPALLLHALGQGKFVQDEYSAVRIGEKSKRVFHDIYSPFPLPVPDILQLEYKEKIAKNSEHFQPALRPVSELLPQQDQAYGLDATNPPGQTMVIWTDTMMIQKMNVNLDGPMMGAVEL